MSRTVNRKALVKEPKLHLDNMPTHACFMGGYITLLCCESYWSGINIRLIRDVHNKLIVAEDDYEEKRDTVIAQMKHNAKQRELKLKREAEQLKREADTVPCQ